MRFYADANGGATYPQAAFELGRFYMIDGKWKDATEYFTKLQKKDPHYAEAAFYAGLGYAKLGELGHALAALVPLSSDVPLIGIYNNAGAMAVQASREEKKDEERARLFAQGTSFLARAAESAPDDQMVHFNYGLCVVPVRQVCGGGRTSATGDYGRPARRAGLFSFRQIAGKDR